MTIIGAIPGTVGKDGREPDKISVRGQCDESEDEMKSLRLGVAISTVFAAAQRLSACGSPTSKVSDLTPKAKSQETYLCQVIPRVDRLIVTRRAPGNQFVFTFPVVANVTSASAARAVASSACALPDIPSGVFHCPAEFPVSYHLVFAVKGEKGMGGDAIDVYSTGCSTVNGLGPDRTPSPGFYRLLARSMGLKNAGNLTFTGTFSASG